MEQHYYSVLIPLSVRDNASSQLIFLLVWFQHQLRRGTETTTGVSTRTLRPGEGLLVTRHYRMPSNHLAYLYLVAFVCIPIDTHESRESVTTSFPLSAPCNPPGSSAFSGPKIENTLGIERVYISQSTGRYSSSRCQPRHKSARQDCAWWKLALLSTDIGLLLGVQIFERGLQSFHAATCISRENARPQMTQAVTARATSSSPSPDTAQGSGTPASPSPLW